MDERKYTMWVAEDNWRERWIDNYNFFTERAKSWDEEVSKPHDRMERMAIIAVRDHHSYMAEGMLMALDICGYAFDGEKIVLKWSDADGETGSNES